MDLAIVGSLGLGFGLGLVHALDADHVMALSVFASRRDGAARGAGAGLRWALGHGLVTMLAGAAVLLLGVSLPGAVALFAERLVGVVMIGLGFFVFFDLLRRRSHLHFHEHDDLPPHAHWHRHEAHATHASEASHTSHVSHVGAQANAHRHEHGPVLVGGLHGLAGAAPVLALLPAARHSVALGLTTLLLFTLGTALAMGVVSGALGHLARRASARGGAVGLEALRAAAGFGSMAAGGFLVATAG